MTNWAIIIGINTYWEASRCLNGAVSDALRFANWLLQSPDCQVPPENMFLLTRPAPDQIPPGVKHHDAIADQLIQTLPEIDQLSAGKGRDRFFFYFSGHGITNYESYRDEQGLVMADFTPIFTNKAIRLSSILDYFKALAFAEQYFFIDACRNLVPWPYDFQMGSTTVKKQIDVKASVDQFILNSTSPRSKAWEGKLDPNDPPGSEQGAFTASLINGLKGEGTAKSFSSNDDVYLVRKDSLFDYVIKKVEDRRIFIIKDPVNPVIQKPKKDGENAKNPVLVRIPRDAVQQEKLDLFVEPDEAWPQARLTINNEINEFVQVFDPPVTGVPLRLPPLDPMIYTVHASASNFVPEGNKKRWTFGLYEPTTISVRLVPLQASISPSDDPSSGSQGGPGPGDQPPTASSGGGGATIMNGLKGLDDIPSFSILLAVEDVSEKRDFEAKADEVMPASSAQLVLESSDSLASLEVADSTGETLKRGLGNLQLAHLKPGFYRARLFTPEGKIVEEHIELSQGESETVRLEAPALVQTPLVKQVIENANFLIHDDNTLDVSKAVGPMASAQISTILALGVSAANRNEGWGTRLKKLGLMPFRPGDVRSGLQIISAFESNDEEEVSAYLDSINLRMWPQGAAIPDASAKATALTGIAGLAGFTRAAQPGLYWLAIEMERQKPVVFSLAIVPERLTMMVFHHERQGHVKIYQYLPSIGSDRSSEPAMVRRLELVQRFWLSGCVEHAFQLVKQLVEANEADPLAYLLGGYLALNRKDPDGLSSLLDRIIKSSLAWEELVSDSYVLLGEHETLRDNPGDAALAFRAALDHGLPIFAEGAKRLHDGVQRYQIDHPRVELLNRIVENAIRGSLWLAWTVEPDELVPERRLEESTLLAHDLHSPTLTRSTTKMEKLYINGISGVTGNYLVPPLDFTEAAGLIKDERLDTTRQQQRLWIKGVWQRMTQPDYGLPFGTDETRIAETGWGIVFHTDEAAEVKKALEPLIEHRRRQVGNDLKLKVLEYRTDESRAGWLARHGVGAGVVDPTRVPYYLLLIGDPDRIPLSFGYLLDVEYGVGRLHFETSDEYARYVASVIDYETSESVPTSKEAIFFATRHPFDKATQMSAELLVEPLAEGMPRSDGSREGGVAQRWGFRARKLIGDQATKAALTEVLRAPGRKPGTFLFTASHGVGWPKGHPDQLAAQGALLCQDWPGFGGVNAGHYFAAFG